MSCIVAKSAEQVIDALHRCINCDCGGCYYHDKKDCFDVLRRDAINSIRAYYRTLEEERARLAEQNKKLLKKKIEIDELREEKRMFIEKVLERDAVIVELKNELDRYKEQEERLAKTPVVACEEVIKIEPVSCDFAKVAKAADKATKACNKLTEALDGLDKLSKRHGITSKNDIRVMFGVKPLNTPPQFIAMPGDVFRVDAPNYGARYFEVGRANMYGIFNKSGSRFATDIVELYRKDENGNLKLIWERKR